MPGSIPQAPFDIQIASFNRNSAHCYRVLNKNTERLRGNRRRAGFGMINYHYMGPLTSPKSPAHLLISL
jgi:hypothetical protein